MGNLIDNKESAQYIIFVDQEGKDINTGVKICEPDSATRIIFVTSTGDQA